MESPEKPIEISKVPPLLVAALVCDVAVTEPSTGKVSLIGIFQQINIGTFPAQRAVSTFFRLTEALGYYPIHIDLVHADTDQTIARLEGEFRSDDRLRTYDSHFEWGLVPIPRPGRYDFRFFAGDMFVGSATLEARQRKVS